MGQKVNPHGARVGVIFDWSTRWYSDKKLFASQIKEDFELPPRELESDKHSDEAETAAEPQNVSAQENSPVKADSIGRSGAYKTLVVAIALLGLGGGVIVLANQKARESKKSPRKV